MDDIEQSTREQRAKTLKDAELLQGLIAHPGWATFIELIEHVGQNFYKQAMRPLNNTFEVTQTEYAKGTLNGLQSAVEMPSRKIAEAKLLRNPSDEEGNTP